jgi:hypothetical protein
MFKGNELKELLGVEKFHYVWIQKVINLSVPIFIITCSSRFSNFWYSRVRLRNMKSMFVKRLKVKGGGFFLDDFKTTIPILIEEYHNTIPKNSLIVFRDLAGEYYRVKRMYSK